MSVTSLPGRALHKLGDFSNRVARWTHARLRTGDRVDCELCEWKGGAFFQGRCPVCNSRARTRLVPYAMRHFGLNARDKTLFHLGPNKPETDWIARTMKPRVHLIADILEFPITNLICDATKMPLPDASVDLIITWHVLEHIPNDRAVMTEMLRVLRPGARVLMSVPIFPQHRPRTYEDPAIPRERFLEVHGHEDHVRSCGVDYGDRFLEAGFTMRRLVMKEFAEGEGAADMERYGLSTGHVVWCFEKRAARTG